MHRLERAEEHQRSNEDAEARKDVCKQDRRHLDACEIPTSARYERADCDGLQ